VISVLAEESMTEIRIKKAIETDTETVASILQEAANWLVCKGTPLWRADELTPDKIREDVRRGMFWIAKCGDYPAGCVRFQLQDPLFWPDVSQDESAFIHRLAVRPEFSGGRVSTALIEWAKQEARRHGRKYLRLDCEAKTKKLCEVYEKRGFVKHSERQVGPYWVARYECELKDSRPGHPGDTGSPRL